MMKMLMASPTVTGYDSLYTPTNQPTKFDSYLTLSGLGTNNSSQAQPVPGLWPQLPKTSQLDGDDGLKVNKVGH